MSSNVEANMYQRLASNDESADAQQQCCPPCTCAIVVAFLLVGTCVCVFFLGSALEIDVDVSDTVHGDPSYIVDAITLTGGALVGVGLLLIIVTVAACRNADRANQPPSCVDRWLPEHFNRLARTLVADVAAAANNRHHVRVRPDGSVNQQVVEDPPVLPAECCFFTWKVCFVLVGAVTWFVANILQEAEEEEWAGIGARWQKGGWVVFIVVMAALAAGVNWIHIRQSTILDYTCRHITNRMVQATPTAGAEHRDVCIDVDVDRPDRQPEEQAVAAAADDSNNNGHDNDDADAENPGHNAPSKGQVIDWVARYTSLVKQHNTTWGYVAMGCSLVQLAAILGLGPATYLNFADGQVASSRINLLAMFSHILLVVPMWMGSAAVTSAGVAARERMATEGRPDIGWLIVRLQAVDWQAKIGGVSVTYTGVMYAVYATMILLLALVRFTK